MKLIIVCIATLAFIGCTYAESEPCAIATCTPIYPAECAEAWSDYAGCEQCPRNKCDRLRRSAMMKIFLKHRKISDDNVNRLRRSAIIKFWSKNRDSSEDSSEK